MNAAARPIHLPGAAALASLRQRAHAALSAWAREWLSAWTENEPRVASLEVCAAREDEHSRSREYRVIRADTGCMWVRCAAADRLSFSRAVVGAELMPRSAAADDWIGGITDHAWDLRNRALCSGLLGAPSRAPAQSSAEEAPAHLFAFGSGAVQLSCEILGLHAIVDGTVWRSMPPKERTARHRLSRLTPLDQAMHGAVMRLDVMLGSVEVELPKLLELARGDVLRLPQRLDQRIAVLCQGRPLARAVLGEAQGRKCVQLFVDDAMTR